MEAGALDPYAVDLVVQVVEPASYMAAHVPGAVLIEPRELVCGIPPATGRLPNVQQLTALFSRIGYRPDLDIVACDDEGGGWAGRFLWTLDVIGHRSWAYLNGGIHAWLAAGRPVETGPATAPEPEPEPADVSLEIDSAPIAEAADVLNAIGDANQVIWDVRSAEEFHGLRRAARRVGHVPGAVNLDWLALKNPFDSQRLVTDIEGLLNRHGIGRDKSIITPLPDAPSLRTFLSGRPAAGVSKHKGLPRLLVRVGQPGRPAGDSRWVNRFQRRSSKELERRCPAGSLPPSSACCRSTP